MATYFVTGATRGIGLELARALTTRGDTVIGTARAPQRPGELESLPVEIVGLDVSDPFSIDGLAEWTPGRAIDVLINNAGVSSSSATLAECDAHELQRVFMINSTAPTLVTRALLPALREGSRRLVVNISSQLASIGNNTGGSSYAYRASKAALNMLTVSMANELRPSGISLVAVHPGWVRTDMGGPKAPTLPRDAAANLVKLFDSLGPASSGKFLNVDGKPIPW